MLTEELLAKTSRTFALAIPLLPKPARGEVCLAYLLFRLADTLEDAELWPRGARLRALDQLADLLDEPADARTRSRLEALRDGWLETAPSRDEACLALLRATPELFAELHALDPSVQDIVISHGARTVAGMRSTIERADEQGRFALATIEELRDYCYTVAGIVGELLTQVFLHDAPQLEAVKETLLANQVAFGEGLQLVNILKDEAKDAADGRRYLPPSATRSEVIALARRDLSSARAYIDALESGGAPGGYVAFTTLSADLADATLTRLEADGAGAKVPRSAVMQMFARVQQRVADLAR
jgi:farnesyl-diphosphate farnesyltransferase